MFSSRDGSGVSLEIESDREEGLLKDVVLISRKLLFCSALPIGEISRNELWNNNQNGDDCFFLWGIYILFFVFVLFLFPGSDVAILFFPFFLDQSISLDLYFPLVFWGGVFQ
jgi:hypothetical protein